MIKRPTTKEQAREPLHHVSGHPGRSAAKILAIACAISGLAQAACGARFTAAPPEETGGVGGEGGGECIPDGEDICDGIDNDCDATTEDGSAEPQLGDGCSTGLDGICAAGTMKCENASMECVQDNQPTTETCNNFDDNCDGTVDESVCTYSATVLGDSDNCHKIVTLDNKDAILPSQSSPDGACIGAMLTADVGGGYKQGIIDDDLQVTVDTEAPIDFVGVKCVAVAGGNMDNVTQTQLRDELLLPGFSSGDVVINCDGPSCTYTKASQCNGGEFPMIGIFYTP